MFETTIKEVKENLAAAKSRMTNHQNLADQGIAPAYNSSMFYTELDNAMEWGEILQALPEAKDNDIVRVA